MRLKAGYCWGIFWIDEIYPQKFLPELRIRIPANRRNNIYKLLKNGAALVTDTQDILDTMGWTFQKQQEQESFQIDGIEKEIFEIISAGDCDLDDILSKKNIEYAELITILTGMELSGLIMQTAGGKYTVCP